MSISTDKYNEHLKERIEELQRTIRFLCSTIENVTENMQPSFAKLILTEAINDKGYTYK